MEILIKMGEKSPPERSPDASSRKRQRASDDSDEEAQAQQKRTTAAATAAVVSSNSNGSSSNNKGEGRTGGRYLPPGRVALMRAALSASDNSSKEYQRMTWEALKKSINGFINKVNVANIVNLVPELFGENLVRGRGLFARSCMKAQTASPTFTPVYAALVAIVNTRIPANGELLLKRLIVGFRKAYRRNDKGACLSTSRFIAHLVNQQVCHEILALQILTLLLEKPTDDSVEVAVGFIRECGAMLTETSPRAVNAIFERFRGILHEGLIDKRVQYMIEVLFQNRKDKFKDNVPIPEGLDLVAEEDIITHYLSLDEESLDVEEGADVFRYDPDYLENEEKYKEIKKEILGEDENGGEDRDEDEDAEGGEGMGEDDEDGDGEEAPTSSANGASNSVVINDMTNTNVTNLRRTIYLTIMSSVDFEEACHKLLKTHIPEGLEHILCNMVIECCSQERSYLKYYGLIGERFAKLRVEFAGFFVDAFKEQYESIHRLETNRLRNVAKFFAHLFSADAIAWQALEIIRLTEEDTNSASRIFIKELFHEMTEFLGLKKLNERLKDPSLANHVQGLFPTDHPKNTRFAINYFTSIGLGGLTAELRDFLKNRK